MRLAVTALGGAIALLAPVALAQKVSLSGTEDVTFITGTNTRQIPQQTGPPTGQYTTYTSKITLVGNNTSATATGTDASETGSIESSMSITNGGNMTATSTGAEPTNTQPCNGHLEFCSRRYSNVTYVAAHNSPFVRPGNSGSNQAVGVTTQLNDGVRLLQAQIQWPSNSSVPHFCHTTCDLLDAGPITKWLGEVKDWVEDHPFDVVTILLGNGNYSKASVYAPYIQSTGILKYTYEPPYLPMALDDWPTLENMIVHGKRVVMIMDYEAEQEKHPWLVDEFAQMWETPFDPVNPDFPCIVQRPPNLSDKGAKNRLYLMNHNLNAKFTVFGASLLVPAVAVINETNAASGEGSLGRAADECLSDWGRAPNFLNVDYYNYGTPPGSVFEVAAQMNNVTYDGDCCTIDSEAATVGPRLPWTAAASLIVSAWFLL